MYVCIHIDVYVCICVYTCLCVCIETYSYTCMHTHTRARAHTHLIILKGILCSDVHRVKMLRALLNFENFGKVLRIVSLDSKYAKALTFENGCQPCYAKPKSTLNPKP
jgi:hypothetical protein